MIHSMTGYGKGEARVGEGTVRVEVRTVNHRFLEFTTRIPRSLYGREKEIERIARGKVCRGHVYITVSMDRSLESEGIEIDLEAIRRIYWSLSTFASREGIPGGVSLDALLGVPELVSLNAEAVPAERLWPAAKDALQAALDGCARMRTEEGAELEQDIRKRIGRIGKAVARVEKRAQGATKRAFLKSKRRMKQLMNDASLDENRLLTEAAILADRMDFSEELVRLKSHIRQFETILDKGGEASKKLTFLLQEIHREATTMGNKAAEAPIISDCISIKESVEKIREQVQNIE
jgi:uncharacterized protein (TIGR00255 family)